MSLKLKPGIEFFPLGEQLFHVYDSSTSRHFKLGKQEVGWLQLLDGTHSIEQLAAEIPFEYFENFMATVSRMGLLETSEVKKPFSLLKIKVLNLNPMQLLDSHPKLSVIYRKFIGWASLPLFILNIVLVAAIFPIARAAVTEFQWGFELIPLYLLYITIIGFSHEISHALVAKSFGVRVPRIGFMLFFLHPAFYADVSAINILPDRKNRLRTLFAGIQANNILVTISLIIALFSIGTPIFFYVLIFAAINFVLIFINLVPFVEYDGYYIFQELLGEPNFGRNAMINFLSPQKSRIEYALYFLVSHIFQIGLIISAIIALRLAVNQMWSNIYIDIAFIIFIICSIPILSVLRLRSAR